ncbi:hypothetical protein DLM_3445 [Aquitalea magnusonii]|uniref:Uncharacterized protein n=1 Tax=Aquitalea magnusonii TaxID=332411 RepID=A0A3G9GJI8_9NEIS|nr:hypothetical protein DLM_3445 [Aquitalea magnusonii]
MHFGAFAPINFSDAIRKGRLMKTGLCSRGDGNFPSACLARK